MIVCLPEAAVRDDSSRVEDCDTVPRL